MPELPEVETMCRGIRGIVGGRVKSVEQPRCDRRPIAVSPDWPELRRRMVGRRVERIDRRGKRVLIVLDDGQILVIEPRMTGLVLVTDPPTTDHLRLRLRLTQCPIDELLFWDRRGLGTLRLLQADEQEAWLGSDRLGPDALQVTAEELQQRLGASRRAIKVALLDQRQVAGIGNLYASEALHVAGIDPRQACNRLSRPQWRRLQAAMVGVLQEAIEHEGSTLSDGTYRNSLNQAGSYQNSHRVYDRAGLPCPGCGVEIERIVQAQRSTFFCPRCQR